MSISGMGWGGGSINCYFFLLLYIIHANHPVHKCEFAGCEGSVQKKGVQNKST